MGIDKQRLVLEGDYDDLVMAAEPQDGQEITLTLTLTHRGERNLVWCEISDPGPGFDAELLRKRTVGANAPSGRGIRMMQRSVDLVRHNPAGNRVVLMQMFTRTTYSEEE